MKACEGGIEGVSGTLWVEQLIIDLLASFETMKVNSKVTLTGSEAVSVATKFQRGFREEA